MNPPSTIVDQRPVKAAEISAKLRTERVRQRREIRDLSAQEAIRRILDPTPELAGLRLDALLCPSREADRPIPGFGRRKFEAVVRMLRWAGHDWIHPKMRLRELSLKQRRQLVSAVLQVAPKSWSGRG